MKATASDATLAENIKSDTEGRVGIMRIMRLVAKLTLDKIQHCRLASRAGNNYDARMPALERDIRKKFEVACCYQI